MNKTEWVDKVENAWDDLEFAKALNNEVRIKRASEALQALYSTPFHLNPIDRFRQFVGLSIYTRDQLVAIRKLRLTPLK